MRSEGNGWFDSVPERVWWQAPLIKLMRTGPMPKHIAFIMDGNRRYARSHSYSSVLDGHVKGFDQLTKVCILFGTIFFSFFAFAFLKIIFILYK